MRGVTGVGNWHAEEVSGISTGWVVEVEETTMSVNVEDSLSSTENGEIMTLNELVSAFSMASKYLREDALGEQSGSCSGLRNRPTGWLDLRG